MGEPLIDAALRYARLGWGVFPCSGKLPAISKRDGGKGFHDATTDADQIARWWSKGGRWNVGLVPPADCYVLDIDEYKPEAAPLAPLVARLGALQTPRQRSGGGGLHFVLRGPSPDEAAIRKAWGVTSGIDVKGQGKGYIVAAPSVHPETGAVYEWELPADTPIADAPDLWPDSQRQPAARNRAPAAAPSEAWGHRVASVSLPQATAALFALSADCGRRLWVSRFAAMKLNFGEAAWPIVHAWSATAGEPKYQGEDNCRAAWESCGNNERAGDKPYKVTSILRDARLAQELGKADSAPTADRTLTTRSADQIEMKNVEWLWHRWLPRKFISVFAADSGSGKSTVTAAIVGALTAPKAWPNEPLLAGRKPTHVLWLGVEDPHAEMTVPRLKAAGAELSRVHFIDGVLQRGATTSFSLQDDLDLLRAEIRGRRERGQEVSTVVVDPVTNYLHGKKRIDPHKATELREVLMPFSLLADEEDIAIICITHLTKDKARGFIDSVLGSGALTQVARLCVGFGRVPGEGDDSYAMFWGKGNLPASQPPPIRYAIKGATVKEPRSAKLITTSVVEWRDEDATITTEEMVGPARGPAGAKRAECTAWLRDRLDDGEWHSAEAVRAEALAAGHSIATLRRAVDTICKKEDRDVQKLGKRVSLSHWRLVAIPTT